MKTLFISEPEAPEYFGFFRQKFFLNKHILFMVGVEKVPIIDRTG